MGYAQSSSCTHTFRPPTSPSLPPLHVHCVRFVYFLRIGERSSLQRRHLQTTDYDVVLSESSISVAEGGVDAEYTVVLDGEPVATTTVDLAVGSSDITAIPTSLSFTSSTWNVPQTVTVAAVDDDGVEDLEEVSVTHSVTVASGTWTGTFSLSENVTVRVYDDDTAGVLLSASALYVDEGSTATYTIALMGSSSDNVAVGTSNGGRITYKWRLLFLVL